MSNVSQFAGNALLAQGGGWEPQRASNFSLIIYGLGDTDTLVLSLKSTDIPGVSFEEGQIKYFNQTVKYASAVTPFENQTIRYNDYIDRATFETLSAWVGQVWNPNTGGIGFASVYKKSGTVYMLPPGTPNAGAVTSTSSQRVWEMRGIWPKSLKHGEFDHGSNGSEPVQISLTLSVDVCVPGALA